jgi:YfiR/HmsC-like
MNDVYRRSGGITLISKGLRWILLSLAITSSRARAASPPTEDQVKALFLYHFTQFVEWPESAYPAPDAPFVIGIVGSEPITPVLQDIIGGESVGRHRLEVRNVDDIMGEFRCQMIYFSGEGETLLDPSRLRTAPVLTVGESDAFCRKGGMIQLFIDHRRVRMRVNLEAARDHSLSISAKLLRVAEVTELDRMPVGIFSLAQRAASEAQAGLYDAGSQELLGLEASGPDFLMGLMQEMMPAHRALRLP